MDLDFWNLWKPKSISKLFRHTIVFTTILTTALVGSILIYQEVLNFRKLEQIQRNNYFKEQKAFIKNIVQNEAHYITLRKKSMEQEYVNELKFSVEQAYELARGIYSELPKNLTQKNKELLKQLISSLKSKDHFRKIFIGSLNGTGIYYPGHPDYENTNLTEHTDSHGNKVVKSEIEFLKTKNEGFIYYDFDTLSKRKVVYLKKFAPLNWYFGGKIYMDDLHSSLKKDIAEKISSVRFRHSGYIFINHINGAPIVLDGDIYTGSYNFFDGSDSCKQNIFIKEIEAAKSSEKGGYFSYYWNKINETKLSPKLSYATYIKDLNWIVGAGFYLDDIDKELKLQKQVLQNNMKKSVIKTMFGFILVFLLEILIITYFDKRYKTDFQRFFTFFKQTSDKYKKIDSSAFYFEEFKQASGVINTMIDSHREVHKKLVEEQEHATQSDKLKTAFLANMSHEIRTPMNAIVGFSDILSSGEETTINKKEIIKYIKRSSHQLLKLIDDIVDISKIESNQLRIVKNAFYLSGFLETIEKDTLLILEMKNSTKVKFVSEYNFPPGFELKTDEFRLKQILLNLLGNAIKFTSEGTIILQVYLENSNIYFSVKDTGIGIAENEQQLIFDRFSQSEIVTGAKYGGTGLGLAISKNLVELLGGNIQLKSKYGEGSEFIFNIPV